MNRLIPLDKQKKEVEDDELSHYTNQTRYWSVTSRRYGVHVDRHAPSRPRYRPGTGALLQRRAHDLNLNTWSRGRGVAREVELSGQVHVHMKWRDESVRSLVAPWLLDASPSPRSNLQATKTKALSTIWSSGPSYWAQQHKRPRQHDRLGFANYRKQSRTLGKNTLLVSKTTL